jgi:hypothetical protein
MPASAKGGRNSDSGETRGVATRPDPDLLRAVPKRATETALPSKTALCPRVSILWSVGLTAASRERRVGRMAIETGEVVRQDE